MTRVVQASDRAQPPGPGTARRFYGWRIVADADGKPSVSHWRTVAVREGDAIRIDYARGARLGGTDAPVQVRRVDGGEASRPDVRDRQAPVEFTLSWSVSTGALLSRSTVGRTGWRGLNARSLVAPCTCTSR